MTKPNRKAWTIEEDKKLMKWFRKITNSEIAMKLGRSTKSVETRIEKVITIENRKSYHWTDREDELLLGNFGNISMDDLSSLLKRTPRAISERLLKLEGVMSPSMISGNYKIKDVAKLLGVDNSTLLIWIKKNEIEMFKIGNVFYIKDEDFWKWIKNNTHKINVKGIDDEEDLVGAPQWYKEVVATKKRELHDSRNKMPFTSTEDALIWRLYTTGVKIKDITANTKRTEDSIKHRLRKLRKDKWG